MAIVAGVAAAAGAVGCFSSSEDANTADSEVVEAADVLKSTLLLDSGCTAVKVGPQHLLLAARCVSDTTAFASGKTITFKIAKEVKQGIVVADTQAKRDAAAPTDAGPVSDATAPRDASTPPRDAGAPRDAGPAKPPNNSDKQATIAEVVVHESFKAKCKDATTCGFGAVASADAKDIAVIVLDAELAAIPTIAVDLDTVNPGDPLLAMGTGCAKIDGTPSNLKTVKTVAAPGKTVNHKGSGFLAKPELVGSLTGGYVITPGQGWAGKDAPKLCKGDIGAPIFRQGDVPVVVGVTSNFTMWDATSNTPVTIHHAKVDTQSKVGTWLAKLGVKTTNSCSKTESGCKKTNYTGGEPVETTSGTTGPGDGGGADAKADDAGEKATDENEPGDEANETTSEANTDRFNNSSDEDEDESSSTGSDTADAGKKKKKVAASGCTTTPGALPPGTGGILFGIGLGVFAVLARRRRTHDAE